MENHVKLWRDIEELSNYILSEDRLKLIDLLKEASVAAFISDIQIKGVVNLQNGKDTLSNFSYTSDTLGYTTRVINKNALARLVRENIVEVKLSELSVDPIELIMRNTSDA